MHHIVGTLVGLYIAYKAIGFIKRHPFSLVYLSLALGVLYLLAWSEGCRNDPFRVDCKANYPQFAEEKGAKLRAVMGRARVIAKDRDGFVREITEDGECLEHTAPVNGQSGVFHCYQPERFARAPAVAEPDQPKFRVLESPVVIQRQTNVRRVY